MMSTATASIGEATASICDKRWSRILTGTGILIAISNMALAWVVMFIPPMPDHAAIVQPSSVAAETKMVATPAQETINTAQSVTQPGGAAVSQMRPPVSSATQDPSMADILKGYTDMIAALRGMDDLSDAQNHSITVVVLAFSFSALAIGFSLFVMGAQGAFAFGHEHKDLGSLVVKTTSPGLLIIISAAILMGVVFVARFGTMDPETEARARVIEAQADAKDTEAYARTQILEAEARVIEARADAYEREAEARASLLEAGLTPEAIDAIRGITPASAVDTPISTAPGLPAIPGLPRN